MTVMLESVEKLEQRFSQIWGEKLVELLRERSERVAISYCDFLVTVKQLLLSYGNCCDSEENIMELIDYFFLFKDPMLLEEGEKRE